MKNPEIVVLRIDDPSGTLGGIRHLRGPFKSYGKAAFTAEVPGQRLVKGKLVDVVPSLTLRGILGL